MDGDRRPKRVAHLIQETLSRVFLEEFQGETGLITVTRVEMTSDLRTAHVYLSFFGGPGKRPSGNAWKKAKATSANLLPPE